MTNKTEDRFYFGKHGQPERFAMVWTGKTTQAFGGTVAASNDGTPIGFKQKAEAEAFIYRHQLNTVAKPKRVRSSKDFEGTWYVGLPRRFSRPGQPERFDASSLNRGNFAEASKSPMLGKLLSEKAMPDGGWRAVQVGSDTLVISFEDADLARDFGRRASTKGYSATSPVATTGRYWNVEVKNGK